jgi:hypothetical protein
MDRRKFLFASGCTLLGSYSSINQEPVMALDFRISDINDINPSSVKSIVLNFDKFNLLPKHIDESENAEIRFIFELEDHAPVETSTNVNIENGVRITNKDIGDATPILLDGVNTTKSFLRATIRIEVDHKNISDQYQQSFVIKNSGIKLFKDSLVGWWPLSRTDTEALDYSLTRNNGTVRGVEKGFSGRSGLQSYRFSGSDDVRIPDNSAYTVDKFTISCWIKINSKLDSGIVSNYGGTEEHYGIRCDNNSGNYVASLYYDDNGSSGYGFRNLYGNSDIGDGKWHHIVGRWDGVNGETTLYVDGTREGYSNSEYKGTLNPSADLLIGNDAGPSHSYFNGLICDVRIYDSALTKEQIQSIYNQSTIDDATPPKQDDGGILHWTLDENPKNVSKVNDVWSNNNGTVYGGVEERSNSIRGSSVHFTGSDSQAIRTDGRIGVQNKVTMAAWINVQKNGDDSYNRYLSYDSSSVESYGKNGILLYWDADDSEWGFQVTIDGNGNFASLQENIPQNNWIHIAGTWDGNKAKLYQNGAIRADTDVSGTFDDSNCKLTVGNRSDIATDHVNAYIDDVRVYNRELSKTEVQAIHRYGTKGLDLRSEKNNI